MIANFDQMIGVRGGWTVFRASVCDAGLLDQQDRHHLRRGRESDVGSSSPHDCRAGSELPEDDRWIRGKNG